VAKTGPKKEFVKQYSYHPGDEPPPSSPWPEAPAAPSARRSLSVLELLDFPASQLGCSIQTARRRPRLSHERQDCPSDVDRSEEAGNRPANRKWAAENYRR
jgi:hypothetical protein